MLNHWTSLKGKLSGKGVGLKLRLGSRGEGLKVCILPKQVSDVKLYSLQVESGEQEITPCRQSLKSKDSPSSYLLAKSWYWTVSRHISNKIGHDFKLHWLCASRVKILNHHSTVTYPSIWARQNDITATTHSTPNSTYAFWWAWLDLRGLENRKSKNTPDGMLTGTEVITTYVEQIIVALLQGCTHIKTYILWINLGLVLHQSCTGHPFCLWLLYNIKLSYS